MPGRGPTSLISTYFSGNCPEVLDSQGIRADAQIRAGDNSKECARIGRSHPELQECSDVPHILTDIRQMPLRYSPGKEAGTGVPSIIASFSRCHCNYFNGAILIIDHNCCSLSIRGRETARSQQRYLESVENLIAV
jgi:hypothetical protein